MDTMLARFRSVQKELWILQGMIALLAWDRATHMPKKAISQRAEQVAYLTALAHEKKTSKDAQRAVKALSKRKNLTAIDAICVKRFRKEMRKALKIPLEHVKKFSNLVITASHVWEEAKEKRRFSLFQPYLEKLVTMKLKEAGYIDAKKRPYDVFLDDFEEGMTVKKIDKVFERLKIRLIRIMQQITASEQYRRQKAMKLVFPFDEQRKIAADIKQRIVPDNDRIALDDSVHPFTTTISEDDVRITAAYRKHDPFFSFTAASHESGHALYELGFSKKLSGTTLYKAPSTGIHESQSRFWENHITKSKAFWQFYYPAYKKHFKALRNVPLDRFFQQLNLVKPSLIRIEADEVTYCLHVIIRYELEKALFERKLKVKDLPKAWNKKYHDYLGITPKDDSHGVLQDVHWSEGYFGYFPTYAIGTMYAAMIFNQMRKENKRLEKNIRSGDFTAVASWLQRKIHRHGATFLAHEIMKKACQKELTPDDFIGYLKEKYYALYQCKQVNMKGVTT